MTRVLCFVVGLGIMVIGYSLLVIELVMVIGYGLVVIEMVMVIGYRLLVIELVMVVGYGFNESYRLLAGC